MWGRTQMHRGVVVKKGFIKGQAEIRVKIQAGVRITESQIKGRSKVGVSENTEGRSREIRSS